MPIPTCMSSGFPFITHKLKLYLASHFGYIYLHQHVLSLSWGVPRTILTNFFSQTWANRFLWKNQMYSVEFIALNHQIFIKKEI